MEDWPGLGVNSVLGKTGKDTKETKETEMYGPDNCSGSRGP